MIVLRQRMGYPDVVTKATEDAAHEAWRYVAEMWFGDENHNRFDDACAAADVTPPQLKAMLSLQLGVAQPMRMLAEAWRCDASWVTRIVDRLEELRYVARPRRA